MAQKEDWSVNGYAFATQKDAKLAENEAAKIKKLEEKLDYKNPKMVKLVYDKTIESGVFKTQVGFAFLKQLQMQLIEDMPQEQIQSIPVTQIYQLRDETAPAQVRVKTVQKKTKTSTQKEKERYRLSLLANMILVILIGFMFYVTTTSKNPNILNYEKAIQNRYADWEQELSEREQTIREKEKELLIEKNE